MTRLTIRAQSLSHALCVDHAVRSIGAVATVCVKRDAIRRLTPLQTNVQALRLQHWELRFRAVPVKANKDLHVQKRKILS